MLNIEDEQKIPGESEDKIPSDAGEKKKGEEDKKKGMDFAKIYEESMKEIKEGDIVKGRIIAITSKDVLVDIGYKSEGAISLEEFMDPQSLKIGDEIEVFLESKEDEEGNVVLSRRKAEKTIGWENIVAKYNEGDVIDGKVVKRVKGGFTVDVGVEAFLPASQASLRGEPGVEMGKVMPFKIVKVNKPRKNIVLSRKDILLKAKEESKSKFLTELEKGQIVQGVVKNITDFGAFVSLGQIDGLLHITDMSWGRISHPSEIVAVGDKIDVMILDVDKENMKVSLGLKQKTPSPWKDAETKYPVDSKVKGKVVNILPYGAFIELEKGVEGLVHVSELSWIKRITHPSEVLAIGDVVEVVVLSIDADNEKISLGIKQTEQNPWLEVESKYTIGSMVKGKVRGFSDYGAFVELEDGLEGFVNISDISWTKKYSHPQEALKKGQKVDAVILDVDAAARKISLGMKQLIPDPWPEISKKYSAGTALEGTVTKATNFGVFVELEKDLEGLIHVSELKIEPEKKPEEFYKAGDKITVKVLKVDDEQRRIALSNK